MIRHFLNAALRNMAANRLQSAITVGGLAMGLTAAILAGLVVANQASYDHFLPTHNRLYLVTVEATLGGRPTDYFPYTPHDLAFRLKQDFQEIEAIARFKNDVHSLRYGNIEAQETVSYADPNIFQLLRLPVLYGDLDTALARPDSIVIPRKTARKYFGRDNVVGETLELDRQHPLKISAVIADLPPNSTNLETGIFVSGASAYSELAQADKNPANARNGNFGLDVETILRLARGTSVQALQSRMLAMSDSLLPRPPIISAKVRLMQLDALHLSPNFSPGVRENLMMFGVVALLILFLSAVNFINLSTARAARRGIEVGVRKATGGGRSALTAQFLGESILQVLFALCVAVALAELLLPVVNAFLNAGAVFDYWRDPVLIAVLLLGALVVGILAGAYPALVMSAFRPAVVLKGVMTGSPKAGRIRQFLVALQFAILVLLVIATGVVFEQHQFAVRENLRLDTDQMLFVHVSKCDDAFKNEVADLPGVRGVACSDIAFIQESNFALVEHPDGSSTALYRVGAWPGLLELYGQHPVAGRALRKTDVIGDTDINAQIPVNIVINETAVRKLGFASPQAAIGQVLHTFGVPAPAIVVGVVKDFSVFALEKKIDATAYFLRLRTGPSDDLLHVKLKGRDIPETLAAIDAAWNQTGATGPIQRTFIDAYVESLHLELLHEAQAFAVFAGVAILLACLGLFGLSLSTAERRVKEIGIRKAMGATTLQIIGLLLWQFSKPVLWANLIAWPIAWFLLQRWLSGFAYHVTLGPWPFVIATTLAVAVALLTVITQAVLAARAVPATSLRYE